MSTDSHPATHIIRAIEADGDVLVDTRSLGLAGTLYTMSCGCVRTYSLDMFSLREVEGLPTACAKHTHLKPKKGQS